ncbi:MAG: UvrD-helicase domain-containing protein, partial [Eubacteriales bacterium]
MEYNGLNKQQLSAVNHTKGAVLVLAGAGSGKTRVLTYRVAKLIEEGVGPYHILALTFTNKAANEMKERIHQLVGNQADNIWIGTFHSVCLKILMMNITKIGYKPGFVIYDADDSLALIKRILKDSRYDNKEVNARTVKYEISAAKNDGYQANDYLTQFNDFDPDEYIHEATAYVFEKYEQNLKENNALDFDDLLIKTIQLFNQDKDTLFY